ncbi:MAG: hypothetical protein VR65_24905 [Desulfobulbaceae bacterium BRH_c16a]|nr:MAG: hypothetical protein VR65_24905 [Desulfobulbaceae bacterium BRH_c16a]
MSEALLQQIVAELAEVKGLLAAMVAERQTEAQLSDVKAEIAMVDAMNIDPVQYLKDKAKERRNAKRKEQQKGKSRQQSRVKKPSSKSKTVSP